MQVFEIIIAVYILTGAFGFLIASIISGIKMYGIPIEEYIDDRYKETKKAIKNIREGVEETPVLSTISLVALGPLIFLVSLLALLIVIFQRKPTMIVLIQHKIKSLNDKEDKCDF